MCHDRRQPCTLKAQAGVVDCPLRAVVLVLGRTLRARAVVLGNERWGMHNLNAAALGTGRRDCGPQVRRWALESRGQRGYWEEQWWGRTPRREGSSEGA